MLITLYAPGSMMMTITTTMTKAAAPVAITMTEGPLIASNLDRLVKSWAEEQSASIQNDRLAQGFPGTHVQDESSSCESHVQRGT